MVVGILKADWREQEVGRANGKLAGRKIFVFLLEGIEKFEGKEWLRTRGCSSIRKGDEIRLVRKSHQNLSWRMRKVRSIIDSYFMVKMS